MTFNNISDHIKMAGKIVYLMDENKIIKCRISLVKMDIDGKDNKVIYVLENPAGLGHFSVDPEQCYQDIKDLLEDLTADFNLRNQVINQKV